MPDHHLSAHKDEAEVFGRNSEVYKGGPKEGALQKLHPAVRVAGAVILLLGIGLSRNPVALGVMFSLAITAAVLSYLNLRSLYKLMLVPVVFVSLPVWFFAAFFSSSLESGALFFIRTLTSLSIAGVLIHSVGLRNFSSVLESFRLPSELRQMWSIMVAQVFSFAGLVKDMALARQARHVGRISRGRMRSEVGRQAGVLFARTWQRGNELAYAMDARTVDRTALFAKQSSSLVVRDYAFMVVCCVLAVGLWLA